MDNNEKKEYGLYLFSSIMVFGVLEFYISSGVSTIVLFSCRIIQALGGAIFALISSKQISKLETFISLVIYYVLVVGYFVLRNLTIFRHQGYWPVLLGLGMIMGIICIAVYGVIPDEEKEYKSIDIESKEDVAYLTKRRVKIDDLVSLKDLKSIESNDEFSNWTLKMLNEHKFTEIHLVEKIDQDHTHISASYEGKTYGIICISISPFDWSKLGINIDDMSLAIKIREECGYDYGVIMTRYVIKSDARQFAYENSVIIWDDKVIKSMIQNIHKLYY